MLLECLAQMLVAGETGAAINIFDGRIRFAQQQLGAGDAAALDGCKNVEPVTALNLRSSSAPVDIGMERNLGHPNLVVALAPDEIHRQIYDRVAGALLFRRWVDR